MSELVYQVSAQTYTARQAADEFASKWFDKPRSIDWWHGDNNTFGLVNGYANYQVKSVSISVKGCSILVWQVWREDKENH